MFPFPELLLAVSQLPIPIQLLELVSRFCGVLVGLSFVVTNALTKRRGQKTFVGSGWRNCHRSEGLPFDFIDANFFLKF